MEQIGEPDVRRGLEALKAPGPAETYERDSREYCENHNVRPADEKNLPVMSPGTISESSTTVKANVFPLRLAKKAAVYLYSVKLTATFEREGSKMQRILTGESKSDYWRIELRKRCRLAFEFVLNHNPNIFPSANGIAYDSFQTFYSAYKIEMGPQAELSINAEKNGDTTFPLNDPYTALEMTIREKDTEIMMDVSNVPGNFMDMKKLERCLDIITNQGVENDRENHVCFENNTSYLLKPGDYGFRPNDAPELPRGGYIAIGAQKACKILKGDESAIPAIVIATKKTPFHACVLVSELVLREFPKIRTQLNGYLPHVIKALKTMILKPVHLPQGSPIQVRNVLSTDASNTYFDCDGENISVQNYYKKRYGIELQFPNLPLILARDNKKRDTYHPMEMYVIADNQRVKAQQSAPETVAALIKVCAVLPRLLEQEVYHSAKSLHLLNNPINEAFGVQVGTIPITAPGRILPPPGFMYRNKHWSMYDKTRNNWRSNAYLFAATIKTWALYSFESEPVFNEDKLTKYAKAFYEQCVFKGMKVGGPAEIKVLPYVGKPDLNSLFDRACKAKCQFIMMVTSKTDNKIHAIIKKMERTYGIVTQNVTATVAGDAAGLTGPQKKLTMENIVNKTNTKLGGINYNVGDMEAKKLLGEDDLYIGISTDSSVVGVQLDSPLPDIQTQGEKVEIEYNPLVVGYSANDGKDLFTFTGDYIFQDPRKMVKLNIVADIVETVLQRYEENRKKLPKRVFFYRNSVAESVYDVILRYEIPVIKEILLKRDISTLVYIVPNKLHQIRLIPSNIQGQKAHEQNLPIGTVVDTRLVSATIPEFFCLGHVARLGTARIPKYSILSNDKNVTMDEIQKLTFHLCFGHQIITGSTSLPSPVFIATRYAERGKMNWVSFYSDSSPQIYDNKSSSSSDEAAPRYTYEHLTSLISYHKSTLRDFRFNA